MKKRQEPNFSLFPSTEAVEERPPRPAAPAGEKDPRAPTPAREIYSVARLNREARQLLEQGLPLIWLEGEISNFSQPSSGHWYFSLKDADAQVRCAMFRQKNQLSQCVPANGLLVQARVRVSLYESRGEYQVLIEHLEEAGEGKLRRQFELLKEKLDRAGLFAAERKRPLPTLPRRIGIVTSPTGAAVHDILHILARRFPAIPVLIYPTSVQGAAAAQEIAATIQMASQRAECDVLIVARGGGSLEDLWAFNDEAVAWAIFNCSIPVVAGIGHEIDFTIADFVADVRAPTPSGAAELTVPDRRQFIEQFNLSTRRLAGAFRQQIKTRETQHAWIKGRLAGALQQQLKDQNTKHSWITGRLMQTHPGNRLKHQAQRLDDLERRARFAVLRRIESCAAVYNDRRLHLWRLSPLGRLRDAAHRAVKLRARLDTAIRAKLTHTRRHTDVISQALNGVSPLATLDRGYAIVTRLPDNTLLRSADEAKVGDRIEARLHHGKLIAVIEEKK